MTAIAPEMGCRSVAARRKKNGGKKGFSKHASEVVGTKLSKRRALTNVRGRPEPSK
jgi:hypothetical protein